MVGWRYGGPVAKIRVPRKGVTQAEVAGVLGRRLGPGFQVAVADGEVIIRRSAVTGAVIKIADVPGATVFRVRGVGLVSFVTARIVADALRRSPEFRSV
jgi:hypothetical protein